MEPAKQILDELRQPALELREQIPGVPAPSPYRE